MFRYWYEKKTSPLQCQFHVLRKCDCELLCALCVRRQCCKELVWLLPNCVCVSIQSHKDKNRQKERHKKSSDGLCSSVTSSSIEKVWKAPNHPMICKTLNFVMVFVTLETPPPQPLCPSYAVFIVFGCHQFLRKFLSLNLQSHQHCDKTLHSFATGGVSL